MTSSPRQPSEWEPTNPAYDAARPLQIGGQAVIEGVMMRAPGAVATAVRRLDGSILVKRQSYIPLSDRYRTLRWPVLRGAAGLIEMLYLGISTLNFSAEIAAQDLQASEAEKRGDGKAAPPRKSSHTRAMLVLTLVVALGLGVGLFFVVPLVVATLLFDLEQTAAAFNLTAGVVRMGIFLGYLGLISLMPDIRRLFQYHGAEHKSIFAFELSDPLEVACAREHSRFHPRCGTSFLLIVMVTAILAFALLDAVLLGLLGELTIWQRLATHLPLIPLIGGVSYEVIKFSTRHTGLWWGKMLIAPGLWLQRVTTKEPDDAQLEVALVALRSALDRQEPSRLEREGVPGLSEIALETAAAGGDRG